LHGEPAKYAVNAPQISAELMKQIGPFMTVASTLGKLAGQLMSGQIKSVEILYSGEISNYDSVPLKASVIGGLMEQSSEERVNMVNYAAVAAKRGIKITEKKEATCENYGSSIDLAVTTDKGITRTAGAVLRGETHITRIDDYFTDILPSGHYFLFADHRDRPGIIGAMGMITGRADVNISAMMLSRQEPRGRALVILALDEPLPEKYRKEMESLPEVNDVRVVQI
jgi:D-3-phosphoglycerate dehydrogenase